MTYPIGMRPKTAAPDLPPRMLRVVRTLKSGRKWISYYYSGRTSDGKRTQVPLGKDLDAAKRKWAELECATPACRAFRWLPVSSNA